MSNTTTYLYLGGLLYSAPSSHTPGLRTPMTPVEPLTAECYDLVNVGCLSKPTDIEFSVIGMEGRFVTVPGFLIVNAPNNIELALRQLELWNQAKALNQEASQIKVATFSTGGK